MCLGKLFGSPAVPQVQLPTPPPPAPGPNSDEVNKAKADAVKKAQARQGYTSQIATTPLGVTSGAEVIKSKLLGTS